MSEKIHGIVIWFNEAKGYGFIRDDTGKEIFAHYRQIQSNGYQTLSEGTHVTFIIGQGHKGPEAMEICVI